MKYIFTKKEMKYIPRSLGSIFFTEVALLNLDDYFPEAEGLNKCSV
jgi:hypothetical protein